MAKFSSPPAGPLAAGLERDFCRCRLEVLHLFENFTLVVGVTSHIVSGAALGPRRSRIASVGAHNRTEMLTIAKSAAELTILRLLGLRARLLSILAV